MKNSQRKECLGETSSWPEPVKFEYHDDFSEENMKKIKEAAEAPSDSDRKWKVVDGPGW